MIKNEQLGNGQLWLDGFKSDGAIGKVNKEILREVVNKAKNEQPNNEQLWLNGLKDGNAEKKNDGTIDKFNEIDKEALREIVTEMLVKKNNKSVAGGGFLCGAILSYLDINKINLTKKTREETDEFYEKARLVLLSLLEEIGIKHITKRGGGDIDFKVSDEEQKRFEKMKKQRPDLYD